MSRGMVSFLAGMGSGYLQAKEKGYERERQAKDDAWKEEQRGRQRQEWQTADRLNADLKDAAAPRETVAGTQTTAGDTKVFSQTPENAAAMQKLLANEAELTGAAPVQAQTTAMTGQMARGHQIGATAEGQNTPDAESQRVQDVYRRNGMRDKAMQEFTANEAYKKAISERMTTMETEGVTAALGLLRAGAPDQAMEAFQKSGSLRLPEGSKFVQVDGTNMFTGKPGKVWSVVGPDGKTIVADVGQVTSKYLGIADQFKFDADIATGQQAQANADRDYGIKLADLEIRANEAKSKQEERALRAEIAQLRASRAGAGSGAGGVSMDGIDKQLSALFTKEDPMSGAKTLDTGAFMAVRQLALRTPQAAAGDSTGAALQAYNAYSAALAKAGGNSAVALQLLNAAMSPQASDQPAEQKSAQAPAGPMTKASAAPQQGGIFRDKNGNIQLMQPLFSLGEARRRMVQEQNEIDASRGF